MSEKMRDGIIKRGSTYSYVVRERVQVPDIDPATGDQRQDDRGRLLTKSTTRPRWVGGFATRTAAKAARDRARNAVNEGTYVAPQDLTVSAWLDQWFEGHKVELKPSSAKTYEDKINLYLRPTIGHRRLQELSPSLLSAVWRELHERGGKNGRPVSVRTVEFARAVLRKSLEDAVVERRIPINPVIGSKMPKRDGKPRHTTWTGAQVRVFLEHLGEDRWAPMWQLFLSSGMRRGEVAGLRWEHVDLDAKTIAIEVSTTQLHGKRVTTTPKNHERRTIAVDDQLVAVLKSWKAATAAERLGAGEFYEDAEGLVFVWEGGRPVMPDYITKTFDRVQRTVNSAIAKATSDDEEAELLPRLVVHEMRHTHATMLLRDRVPVHIVSKRLGHKDPSVTLNVYADAIPDDDISAADVFRKAVWGA